MYPYLLPETFGYRFPMYDIMIVIGVLVMLAYVVYRLMKFDGYTKDETIQIVSLIVISLFFALLSSFLLDGIFHSIETGEWEFGSLNFLSGLVGGVISFLVLMKYLFKEPSKDMRKIMNTIITGVVVAHMFGRIGCFLAGCCFGIPTESFLGVLFPHGHAHLRYPGEHVFPTQLFEVSFLLVLFILMNTWKFLRGKEIETYLFGYGVWRILIEFIRGDDRGVFIPLFETQYNIYPTPAQAISVGMIVLAIILYKRNSKKA